MRARMITTMIKHVKHSIEIESYICSYVWEGKIKIKRKGNEPFLKWNIGTKEIPLQQKKRRHPPDGMKNFV